MSQLAWIQLAPGLVIPVNGRSFLADLVGGGVDAACPRTIWLPGTLPAVTVREVAQERRCCLDCRPVPGNSSGAAAGCWCVGDHEGEGSTGHPVPRVAPRRGGGPA